MSVAALLLLCTTLVIYVVGVGLTAGACYARGKEHDLFEASIAGLIWPLYQLARIGQRMEENRQKAEKTKMRVDEIAALKHEVMMSELAFTAQRNQIDDLQTQLAESTAENRGLRNALAETRGYRA